VLHRKYSARDSMEYRIYSVITEERIQHRNYMIKLHTLVLHWHADAYESFDNQPEYFQSSPFLLILIHHHQYHRSACDRNYLAHLAY
jgi:hypothetical protein